MHSIAVPERGFPVNNALLGKEKLALAENTIVAQRVVKDCVQIFGSITMYLLQRMSLQLQEGRLT